ncbi:MAG: hypothetical protein PHO91_00545 [Patescibacteria group bacterium]|nr:hypothetical protein [Patescibacteria group bacterium]
MKKVIEVLRPLILQPFTLSGGLLQGERKINNFFISFSDALVCIFSHYKISGKKEVILMPNFYCIETLNFISKYLNIIFYKVNDDFSIDKNNYFQQIIKYQPRIILNYSFLGFSLSPEEKIRLVKLCNKETIFIDDFAHKILSTSEISPINENHFYIDSIRKHCSLLGAHLINRHFHYSRRDVELINWYKIKCELTYLMYRVLIFFIYIFNSTKIYSISEKVFIKFNSFIGEPPNKATMGGLSFYIYNFIDFKKIIKHNKSIILTFHKHFNKIKNKNFKILPRETLELSSLINYYPVFIEDKIQSSFIEHLSKNKIFPWRLWDLVKTPYLSELNTKLYTSFLVFPVNWQISSRDVEYIYDEVNKFFCMKKDYE